MDENRLIIDAPFYRGFILLYFNSLFYVALMCIIIAIAIIVTGTIELTGIIVAIFLVMLISYVAIKIYRKAAKSRIIIDEQEIAKYRGGDRKVKSIKLEDVEGMYFAKYSFPSTSFDEFNICSNKKNRIHFYALCTLVEDIEKITKIKFKNKAQCANSEKD